MLVFYHDEIYLKIHVDLIQEFNQHNFFFNIF